MKKNKYLNAKKEINEGNEIQKAIKIVVGVVIVFVIVYFLGGIITGNIKFAKEKPTEVSIQYSEILAESTFKQKENEYFVLFYDFDSNDSILMDALIPALSNKLVLYKVDLSKKFNENYISDSKLNTNPKKLNELKVKSPTLIRLKNGKIINFVIGNTDIKTYTLKLK